MKLMQYEFLTYVYVGGRADLILVFFDPIGQALCRRTLNVVGEYVINEHCECVVTAIT